MTSPLLQKKVHQYTDIKLSQFDVIKSAKHSKSVEVYTVLKTEQIVAHQGYFYMVLVKDRMKAAYIISNLLRNSAGPPRTLDFELQ